MKFNNRGPDENDFIFMKSVSSNSNTQEWKRISKACGV